MNRHAETFLTYNAIMQEQTTNANESESSVDVNLSTPSDSSEEKNDQVSTSEFKQLVLKFKAIKET